ncbi:MAG: AsmA-like C-terminal region-containing protein [Pseudomonadota bacterium]
MLSKKIRPFVIPPLLLLLLGFALILFSNFLVQQPSVQAYLIERLSESIGVPIHTRKIDLSFWRGLGITVQGLKVESKEGKVSAARARVVLDARALLRGQMMPVGLELSKFAIDWEGKAEDCLPLSGGGPLKAPPLFWIPGLKTVLLEDGQVRFQGKCFDLDDFSCELRRKRGKGPVTLMLSSSGKLGFKGERVPFGLRGTVSLPDGGQGTPLLDIGLKAEGIPLIWIPWPEEVPFKKGKTHVDLGVKGVLGGKLAVNGSVTVESTRFSVIDADREKTYLLPKVTLDFKSDLEGDVIRVPSLTLKTAGLSLPIVLELDLRNRSNPFFSIRAGSSDFSLETCLKYLPTPFIPLWVEKTLLPLLVKGDITLEHLSFKGRPDQFHKIHLPENHSVVEFGFLCKNFQLHDERAGQPFETVSAEVTLKGGSLDISRLKAGFGRSRIHQGSLGIREVFSDISSYSAYLDGSFELQELIKQLHVGLIPEEKRPQFYGPLSPSGNLDCRVSFLYRTGWDSLRVKEGEFTFRDCSIDRRLSFYPFRVEEALFLIHENRPNGFEAKGSWGKSTFHTRGSFALTGSDLSFQQAEFSSDVDMGEMIPLFYGVPDFPLSFNRPVACRFSLKRGIEKWSCQGNINLEGIVLETEKLIMNPPGNNDRITFDIDLGPRGQMDLNKIQILLRESSMEFSGSYNFDDEEFSRVKISIPSFLLEDLGIWLKKVDIQARGRLAGHVFVKIDRHDPQGTRVTGRMTGENLLVFLGALPSPIEDGRFKMDFIGNRVSVPSLGMRLGKSTIQARGELTGWQGLRGNVWISSDYFDPVDFSFEEGATKPERELSLFKKLLIRDSEQDSEGFLDKLDLHLALDILKGKWMGLEWGPLEARLGFRENKLHIEKAKVQMAHGEITVRGHLERGPRPGMLFSSHIRLRDQPIEHLIENFHIKNVYLEGGLTLETVLFMKGRDKQELISGMTGFSDVLIQKGVIKKSSVLLNVLNFLSLQKLFKKIPEDISEDGFYFETIQAHTAIEKGILRTENAVMTSPAVNAVASGTLNLNDDRVDYDLGIEPLETIDTLVGNIPILGYILTGEDKKLLTYYFKVKGPLTGKGPEVDYVPFKNLGKGTASLLKRLFLTPYRLLKSLPKPGGPGAGVDVNEDIGE